MYEPQKGDDTAAGDEGQLSPEQAARLIEQTTRQAKRQFELRSPWVTLLGAAAWFAIYGTLWLSVRGQHPYTGPTGWALLVVFALIIVSVIADSVFIRRCTAGVSYAIVYGVYAAAGWLIVIGAAGVAIAAGSCFAGPIGVWFFMGLGGFLVLLALAAYQFRLRRR